MSDFSDILSSSGSRFQKRVRQLEYDSRLKEYYGQTVLYGNQQAVLMPVIDSEGQIAPDFLMPFFN